MADRDPRHADFIYQTIIYAPIAIGLLIFVLWIIFTDSPGLQGRF